MARIEIVVGYIEKGTATAVGSDTLVNAINNKTDNFVLANQVNQIVATVVSAVPILRPINVQVNTLAATTQFLSIVAELKAGKTMADISAGDYLTLIGNVAGVVGTFAFFVGATPATLLFISAIGIGAGVASVVTSANMVALRSFTQNMVARYWPTQPTFATPTLRYTGSGQVARYDTIKDSATLKFVEIVCLPDGTTFEREMEEDPEKLPDDDVDGDGEY